MLFTSLSGLLSCESGGGGDSTNYNNMTFTVNGTTQKVYKSIEGNGFIHDTADDTYWNVWDENWDADVSDYVIIELPISASSGTTIFTEEDTYFSFSLNLDGEYYSTNNSADFILNITEWNSIGGMVKGTFSGTLINISDSTSVDVDGSFEATNNTNQTEK